MDSTALTISVIVISWNQRALLEVLVEQLLNQDFQRDRYEVIVVDDGSSDGSREWLQSLDISGVRCLFGDLDRGRAASRNRGIRAAKGGVVVMIDGDHTVPRHYLSTLAERHARERCVVVGRSDFADHPDVRALNYYLNEGGAAKLPEHARLPGRYFLTRSCSVPRDLLLEVGLFDESFTSWGGEDLDLGMRLEATGVPIYGESRYRAIHHHHRTLNDLLKTVYEYGRSSVPILLERHPQLFRELNLNRVLPDTERGGSGSRITRVFYRIIMTAPVYVSVRTFANVFRRYRLPRFIFDYLHLRQYTRGYQSTLRPS